MLYFGMMAFVTRLGEASLIQPAVASWTPTIAFALLALNRHTSLRT
jgi:lipopolysaccharide export LptBFGC system permease protein LptF